jgi:hypothetical protein
VRPWRPTLAQQRYLTALFETTAVGKFHTQKQLAEMVGVHGVTVSNWNHDDRFYDAVNDVLARAIRPLALRAEVASLGRAIRGSHQDWRTYLEMGGPTSWRAAQTDPNMVPAQFGSGALAPTDPTVQSTKVVNGLVVHVHAIPERRPMSELPPAVELEPGETMARKPLAST